MCLCTGGTVPVPSGLPQADGTLNQLTSMPVPLGIIVSADRNRFLAERAIMAEPDLPPEESEGTESGAACSQRIQRRKADQGRRMAETAPRRGDVIVNTEPRNQAGLGMVLRSLGHGYRVAIVQFKGAWEPAEKRAIQWWGSQLQFRHGRSFTWETQDKVRDKLMAQAGWEVAMGYLADPEYHLVLLDEVNIALKKDYLSVDQVLAGINQRPPKTHVVLTGRNAPQELIERADLVTEMSLIKHPLKLQRIRAQAGIEF
jgi:cob(I)alamin adenosyltransferase